MKKINKIFPILILVILIIATLVLSSCDFGSTNTNNGTNQEQINPEDNNNPEENNEQTNPKEDKNQGDKDSEINPKEDDNSGDNNDEPNPGEEDDQNINNPPHVHEFSEEWTHNETHHWHSATCDHSDEKDSYGEHEFINGKCVCGFVDSAKSIKYLYHLGSYEVVGVYNKENIRALVIPDKYKDGTNGEHPVKSIGEYAFRDCTSLTNITIPSSVTSIGDNAFSGCYKLVEVYNKANIDLTRTDYGANIFGLYFVKNIYTEEGGSKLSKEGDYVIYTDGELKELISYEGTSTEIAIPNSVTSIGDYAFSGCENLQYNEYEGIKYLGNETNPYLYLAGVLDDTKTTYTIHNDTKSIGYRAFYGCSNLTSITIPSSVTSIGTEAFYGCSSLTRVNISSIESWLNIQIEGVCFDIESDLLESNVGFYINGEEVTTLEIPNTITKINRVAFYGWTSLTSIIIPDSVTSIGDGAFAFCTSLTNITIPSSVTSIGTWAFIGCYRLVEVYNKSNIDLTVTGNYGNIYGLFYVKNIYTEEGGSKLSKEGDYVIYTDGELKEVIKYDGTTTNIKIPSSMTGIGCFAFFMCGDLTSISFGDNSQLTSIGEGAFYGCRGLTNITIPSSVTSIGNYAFFGCDNLTIYVEVTSNPNGWDYDWPLKDEDGEASYHLVYWYSETEPTEAGNYWHYVDGVVTIWE